MGKYKIIASKGQKKYTLIVHAQTEIEAKEKIHKEGYSILALESLGEEGYVIEGQQKKFKFQAEKGGEVVNGIIIGDDIFKLYVKLREEHEYKVFVLYPEGESEYESAEKKQKLIEQLEKGYELQKSVKNEKEEKNNNGDSLGKRMQEKYEEENTKKEESFHLKKELDQSYALIEKVLKKFEETFENRETFHIDDDTFHKLHDIYNKVVYIRNSTNIAKLREIGEMALVKLAKIQLDGLQKEKTQYTKECLKDTNNLLKKFGSKQQFRDPQGDIVLIMKSFIEQLSESLDIENIKTSLKKKKKQKIDTKSYEYLKLVLQIEKYEKKKKNIQKEMLKKFYIYINPFHESEEKTKTLLKKNVIEQNITILKAKKSGHLGSYTFLKRGFHKTFDEIKNFLSFLEKFTLLLIVIFVLFFLFSLSFPSMFYFNTSIIPYFLMFFMFLFLTEARRNAFALGIYIVFFLFLFIFIQVNF